MIPTIITLNITERLAMRHLFLQELLRDGFHQLGWDMFIQCLVEELELEIFTNVLYEL